MDEGWHIGHGARVHAGKIKNLIFYQKRTPKNHDIDGYRNVSRLREFSWSFACFSKLDFVIQLYTFNRVYECFGETLPKYES